MYPYAIIFEGDTSPLAAELCEALAELGLTRESTDTLTPDLLDALNTYREANGLTKQDFCEPVTLRALGIDARGDELLSLARAAEALAVTELGYYDVCREIVNESRALGITVSEAIARRGVLGQARGSISESAMRAAALAFIG